MLAEDFDHLLNITRLLVFKPLIARKLYVNIRIVSEIKSSLKKSKYEHKP